MRPKKPELKDN